MEKVLLLLLAKGEGRNTVLLSFRSDAISSSLVPYLFGRCQAFICWEYVVDVAFLWFLSQPLL